MNAVRRTGFERGMKERFAANEISDLSSDSDSAYGPNTDDFDSQG